MPAPPLHQDMQQDALEEEESLYEAVFVPITSRINALGGLEDTVNEETGEIERLYRLGDECLGCLRDLKKFWRKFEDDENRTVARIFHEAGLMANDLLPILQTAVASGDKGRKIALACADLMMAMTWPINVAEELQEADLRDEVEKTANRDFKGLQAIQLGYKAAILRAKAVPALFSILLPILEIPKHQRRPKDDNIMMLILHIFRNLAAIKDKASSTYHSTESLEQSSLQSELIMQMHDASVFEFLTTLAAMASERDYRKWILIVLDIFHLVFCNVKASELVADVEETRKGKLADLLQAEQRSKRVDARKGASRHSRFGTTVSLTTGDRRYVMHKQAAVFVSPTKILDQAKKGAKKQQRLDDDLGRAVELRPKAVQALQQIALAFLDSAFNSFVEAMIYEIKNDLIGSTELDRLRFLVVSALFLEYFNLLQKDEARRAIPHDSPEGHDFDLVASMMTAEAVALPMARMIEAYEEKPANWTELHAGVNCLTQCLLTMEALSQSPDKDYREVGDVLQHKFYYDPEPLERIVVIIGTYKGQSKKYLDSIIHLSYVLLRMLEQYSKTNAYMHIKKKKRNVARKKQERRKRRSKEGDDDENPVFQNNSSDDEEADYERNLVNSADHLFQFSSFEAKFASENVLATCLTYLSAYPTFTSEEQMKRLVSLMHRMAVKAHADALFFKTSALSLFQSVLDNRKKLPRQQSYDDLIKLVEFIVKRFFKLARSNPMMLLETFFPTRKGDISKMVKGYNIYDPAEQEHLKMPAEIEVRQGFTETQQLGIAIANLSERNEEFLLEWVREALKITHAVRQEIVYSTDKLAALSEAEPSPANEASAGGEDDAGEIRRRLDGPKPSDEAIAKFAAYTVPYDSDEQKESATRNSPLKLVLRLLEWESAEDVEANCLRWTIPASRLPSELNADINIIDNFLINPLDSVSGKAASELVKRTVRRKPRVVQALSDGDDALDPATNLPKAKNAKVAKRKRRANSDEDSQSEEEEAAATRRKKRKAEVVAAFKSAQFIDSDDDKEDEERDRLFFAREMEKRKQREEQAAQGGLLSQQPSTQTAKVAKPKKKRRKAQQAESEIEERQEARGGPKKPRKRVGISKPTSQKPQTIGDSADTPSLATSDSPSSETQENAPSTPLDPPSQNAFEVDEPQDISPAVRKTVSYAATRRIVDSDEE